MTRAALRRLLPREVTPWLAVRAVATATALARISLAARRRRPLTANDAEVPPGATLPPISVVVPARDEATRIGPLLASVVGAPGVVEVLVVDDGSTDATGALAEAAGARVLPGIDTPPGWAGKVWALHQGVLAATGEWVVLLDADTRPSPRLPAALVRRALADHLDLVTLGGRFECPTAGARWLHPAMLTTLVLRYGPAGRAGRVRRRRLLANGQCMAARRGALVGIDGFRQVHDQVVEDVALARFLDAHGWSVAMLDGPDLLTTRMYEDLRDTWSGWGRSLALPSVEPGWHQVADLAVLTVAQALPLPRLLTRRADLLDAVLLLARLGTLAGTAAAYTRRGAAYWCSPLADPVAVAAVAGNVIRPRRDWRGRSAPR